MKTLLAVLTLFLSAMGSAAQSFEQYFEDNTLRLDYIFAGDAKRQDIFFCQAYRQERWAGRRGHLTELPAISRKVATIPHKNVA